MSDSFVCGSVAVLAVIALTACGGGSNPSGEGGLSISGTPSTTAQVGHVWRFQPNIRSPDGEPYVLEVDQPPPWMAAPSMTAVTNQWELFGEPRPEHAGTHWPSIVVRVTDGQTVATLPSFHIAVIAEGAATGTVQLRWLAPTERVDGSPIGELASYRLLYGQTSGRYDRIIIIDNPGISRYLVEDLGPGTWYFALVAVTSDGFMSDPSAQVSKRLDP
jgi:hypothetical protein